MKYFNKLLQKRLCYLRFHNGETFYRQSPCHNINMVSISPKIGKGSVEVYKIGKT